MILTPSNEYAAVLDACVLLPMPLCDTLLRLAEEPALFRPLWSAAILEEVERNLVSKWHKTRAQAMRRVAKMRAAFPEAEVAVPEGLALSFRGATQKHDSHVVAAAVLGHANAIVTQNLKHFDAAALAEIGILCHGADEFLLHQYHLRPGLVLEKMDEQAANLRLEQADIARMLQRSAPQFSVLILQSS